MRTIYLAAIGVVLAGCGSPRSHGPSATLVAAGGLDAVSTCLIDALDRHHRPMAWNGVITYHAQTVRPGAVYEIKPQQLISAYREAWFVRATKLSPAQTKLETFGPDFLADRARECVA